MKDSQRRLESIISPIFYLYVVMPILLIICSKKCLLGKNVFSNCCGGVLKVCTDAF